MRAPAFWWEETPTAVARLLTPLGTLYGTMTARRMRQAGTSVSRPVICVGNFIAGGAGKTPVAAALAEILQSAGASPVFLSRGYGGSHRGAPRQVIPGRDRAGEVGDEPLLLARIAPAFICADRVAGAESCVAAGADVIILDDGLQNPRLHKDLTLAVVDGASGIGNGLCLPAGPLRAPLLDQWPFVQAVVVVGEGAAGACVATQARAQGLPVFEARLVPDPAQSARLCGQRVYAFAGIGRPEKFFATLRQAGAKIVGQRAFADHQPYTTADLAEIRQQAAAKNAVAVTTEKDLVRIADPAGIEALPVRLEFFDREAIRSFMAERLPGRS
jgi:tetraacyldisaccharide 4'-kinase